MTKEQVISIMGKGYDRVGASVTPEGDREVLGYQNTDDGVYLLYFLDGKLVAWDKERIKKRPSENPDIRE